jgi:hypothetical protein
MPRVQCQRRRTRKRAAGITGRSHEARVTRSVQFLFLRSGIALSPQKRGCRPGRRNGWGDSFQGGPECSLSVQRRTGRRYRQRESENEPEKTGQSAVAELPGSTRTTSSMERVGRLPLKKSPCQCRCAAGRDEPGVLNRALPWGLISDVATK